MDWYRKRTLGGILDEAAARWPQAGQWQHLGCYL